jgi:predicted N-acetyltransferase YhbS
MREMLAFADVHCLRPREGRPGYRLRVPENDGLAARIAGEQGLVKTPWSEPLAARPISEEAAKPLPAGYCMRDGKDVDPSEKARVHSRAFGYAFDDDADFERARTAFDRVRFTPDYREELDMIMRGPQGNAVSFATVWLDEKNALCVLEPVGTAPEHRRKGLAEILIAEGCRRAAARGARRVFVGSDQPFYRSIGFRVVCRQTLWEKNAAEPRPVQ